MQQPPPTTNFWQDLPRPIVGLAPMDGVTDAACRFIMATLGHPAVIVSEFTAVDGLNAGAERLLDDFYYHPIERPVVAQVFGAIPENFVQAAAIAAALGFDGLDINMGCPVKNVAERGAGAALIRHPERALAIITAAREGIARYAAGESLEAIGVHPRLVPLIHERMAHIAQLEGKELTRRIIPVSVKTRIGYDEPEVTPWINTLLSTKPAVITVHGRTLKQLYTGTADWEAIRAAADLAKGSGTLILGNGDVQNLEDGIRRAKAAGTDGFLIGRKAVGNPWIFTGIPPQDIRERTNAALAHARYLFDVFGERGFTRIRKHLLEYTKEFPNAREVRTQLSMIHTLSDVERVLGAIP